MKRSLGTSSSTGSLPPISTSTGACRVSSSRPAPPAPGPGCHSPPPDVRNRPPAEARRQQADQRDHALLHGIGYGARRSQEILPRGATGQPGTRAA